MWTIPAQVVPIYVAIRRAQDPGARCRWESARRSRGVGIGVPVTTVCEPWVLPFVAPPPGPPVIGTPVVLEVGVGVRPGVGDAALARN
jgi:hypothetical protein